MCVNNCKTDAKLTKYAKWFFYVNNDLATENTAQYYLEGNKPVHITLKHMTLSVTRL